jgi:biotin carboxyl carrier protein
MIKIKLKINKKNYNVEILKEDANKIKIKVDDKNFVFEKQKQKKEQISVAKSSIPKRDFSKKEIKTPITGEVSEIFVKVGDFVKRNQKLIILSAMKMENEIISNSEGKVKKILVTKNQKVNCNDVLIILE